MFEIDVPNRPKKGVITGGATGNTYTSEDIVTATGYLMDVYCVRRDMQGQPALDGVWLQESPQDHTIHCLQDPSICVNSGYGLWVRRQNSKGFFLQYRFDDQGNTLAYNWLASIDRSKQYANALVTVSGYLINGKGGFSVTELRGVQNVPVDAADPATAADIEGEVVPSPTPAPTKLPGKVPTPRPSVTSESPSSDASSRFDWGQGCDEGQGSFQKMLPTRKVTEDVGVIPPGKFDLSIDLSSESDIDIVLYDLDDTSSFPEGKVCSLSTVLLCCSANNARPTVIFSALSLFINIKRYHDFFFWPVPCLISIFILKLVWLGNCPMV